MGLMHYNGEGTPKNFAKAIECFQHAAEHGKPDAQCKLGLMHYNGEGTPKNFAKAIEWSTRAASQMAANAFARLTGKLLVFLTLIASGLAMLSYSYFSSP